MKNLELVITRSTSKTQVTVSGNVVAIDAHDFSQALIDLVHQGEALNIDMTEVTDIGFTGFNALKLVEAGLAQKNSALEVSINRGGPVSLFVGNTQDALPFRYVEDVYLMTAA